MSPLPYPARSGTVDAIVFNNILMAGERPVFMNYIIAGGQSLAAGSVLGRITASGKLVLSAAAAGDGSQTPMAILLEPLATYDVDGTTSRDTPAKVLVHGFVNWTALVYGAGHSYATVKDPLRAVGIHTNAPGYSG